jgi:hypothetical protein
MSVLALAALGSGVAVVLVLAAIATVSGSSARRTVPRDDLRPALAWAALALAAWELCGVVAGGSYWLHYLTGLLPGTLLLLALAAGGSSRRWRAVLTGCVAYLVLASAAVWGQHVVAPAPVSDDARVVAYLRANAQHGDGVVTAFGHPDIVAGSGLSSPYEHLWSLPVRVRDPQLSELAGVLRGPDAPGWVVVAGDSLDSWGLDATATQRVFDRHYAHRVTFGEWQVWQRRGGSPGQVSP